MSWNKNLKIKSFIFIISTISYLQWRHAAHYLEGSEVTNNSGPQSGTTMA
jgi:hypothetical protein